MRVRMYQPATPLAPYVDIIWSCDGDAPAHRTERVLPDGSMQLILHREGEPLRVYDRDGGARLVSSPVVCGPRARFSLLDTAQHGSLLGVHFRPGGAAPLLGVPASALCDMDTPLEALWGSAAVTLMERLSGANSPEERVRCLHMVLLARVAAARLPSAVVDHGVRTLAGSSRVLAIADLAAEAGLSHRRYIAAFREAVGLTPMTYRRVARFQAALHAIARGAPVPLAALAAQTGYYDQAHFARDFRAFAGLTPARYLARRGEHQNHVAIDL